MNISAYVHNTSTPTTSPSVPDQVPTNNPADVDQSSPPKKQKKELSIQESCEIFLNSEWKFIHKTSITTTSVPCVLARLGTDSRFQTLKRYFNDDIVAFLVVCTQKILTRQKIMNENLARKRTSDQPTRYANLCVSSFWEFYAVHMLVESTFGNHVRSINEHITMIKEMYKVNYGIDRYKAYRLALNPSIEEILQLSQMFCTSISKQVSTVNVVTVDECMVGYQPNPIKKNQAETDGEPIPVTYISRKPHPNGLLIYGLASYVKHPKPSAANEESELPFILNLRPHLKVGDAGAHNAVRYFMEHWRYDSKPHLCADSAFGSFELMKDIANWGGKATMSVAQEPQWLWKVLSYCVPPDHWRAAQKDNLVVSVHAKLNKDTNCTIYKHVISNAYQSEVSTTNNNNNQSSVKEPTISELPPNSGNYFNTATDNIVIPNYEENYVSRQTIATLKEWSVKYNIRCHGAKNKEDWVKAVMGRIHVCHGEKNQFKKLQQYINKQWNPDPSDLHIFYGNFFNFIDAADRQWYAVEEHHGMHQWKSKMTFAILRFMVMDAWVHHVYQDWELWITWRLNLCREILGLDIF